jgi:hypothetical protein
MLYTIIGPDDWSVRDGREELEGVGWGGGVGVGSCGWRNVMGRQDREVDNNKILTQKSLN